MITAFWGLPVVPYHPWWESANVGQLIQLVQPPSLAAAWLRTKTANHQINFNPFKTELQTSPFSVNFIAVSFLFTQFVSSRLALKSCVFAVTYNWPLLVPTTEDGITVSQSNVSLELSSQNHYVCNLTEWKCPDNLLKLHIWIRLWLQMTPHIIIEMRCNLPKVTKALCYTINVATQIPIVMRRVRTSVGHSNLPASTAFTVILCQPAVSRSRILPRVMAPKSGSMWKIISWSVVRSMVNL